MKSRQVGNLDVFIEKRSMAPPCDQLKIRLTSLQKPLNVYEKNCADYNKAENRIKFDNIPLGQYKIEALYNYQPYSYDIVRIKNSGADTNWQGHFQKSRNRVYIDFQYKSGRVDNLHVRGDEVPIIIKGAGAGWAGQELTLRGRIAVRLSGENFYITGRPQRGMWVPKSGSTSKLFIYTAANPKKVFRLDYHAIQNTGGHSTWHYNVTKGFAKIKGLNAANHSATPGAAATGQLITIFRWGGRAMFVVGAGMSIYDVYHAENKVKEITRQAGGWAAAIAGGKYGADSCAKLGTAIAVAGGQAGPQVATPEEIITVPAGALIGSIIGGIGGGFIGFIAGKKITETVFDWVFEPLEKEEWIIYSE